MDMQKTFKVVFTSILALPEGRERDILIRKTLALRAGFKSTATLRKHDVKNANDAFEMLSILSDNVTGLEVDCGSEPRDPSDRSEHPVSLESFAVNYEAEENEVSTNVAAYLRELIKEEAWQEAALTAVSGFSELKGRHRRKMVPFLAIIGEHEPKASLFYGQALINGQGIKKDFARGYALLMGMTGDEDSNISGYAHFQLGQALVDQPGRGYEALRHFESAAFLGWEDGSESAGVLCQLGQQGVPLDWARAARNFRFGITKGQAGCMTKYALMILSGQIDYDPVWQQYYDAALDKNEHVAIHFYGTVLDAQEKAAGDLPLFLENFRKNFNTKIDASMAVDVSEFGLGAG